MERVKTTYTVERAEARIRNLALIERTETALSLIRDDAERDEALARYREAYRRSVAAESEE